MITLTDSQEVSLSISPKSKKGNPAKVDGTPAWSSSDDTIVSLDVSADGFSATAIATGKLGTAQVRVDADADLGSGVAARTALVDVEVVAGMAVALDVTAGVPTEQEEAPAPPATPTLPVDPNPTTPPDAGAGDAGTGDGGTPDNG